MFFLPTKINLGRIKINEVGLGSTFSIGQTKVVGHHNTTKKNQGFGQQGGEQTTITVPIHIVNDADYIDSIIIKSKN